MLQSPKKIPIILIVGKTLTKRIKKDTMVSQNPKANITLEKSLIDEVKAFIEAKREDPSFLLKTPTAVIREATINYIYQEKSISETTQKSIDQINARLIEIERNQARIADQELKIYLKMTALLIDLFDNDHDYYDILALNKNRLNESQINAVDFREFTREEIEQFFLDNLQHSPEEYKDLFVKPENELLNLLLMFLFLCNIGFTRKWEIVDPIAPVSMKFLQLLKEIIKKIRG